MPDGDFQINIPMLPTQWAVWNSKAQVLAWIAAVGTGKTKLLAWTAAKECLEYKNNIIVVAAATAPQLAISTIPKCLQEWDEIGLWYDYKAYKNIVTFANGSWLRFQSLDVPAEQLKGSELGALLVDEADGCDVSKIEALFGRVRRPGTSRRIRLFGNSPHPGHWLEEWFMPRDPKKKPRGELYQASTYENEFLAKDYIKNILEPTYPPGTPGHDRYMLGKFGVALAGAVYPEFDTKRHVISASEVPKEVLGYVHGLDFGFFHPTVFLVAALGKDDVLYFVDEYCRSQAGLADHAEAIRRMYRGGPIMSDHDAQDRFELESYGISTICADKNVLVGIALVKKRFREGKIKIVAEKCPRLMSEIPYYCWDTGRGGEDRPVKINDDSADCMRYIVNCLDHSPILDAKIAAALRSTGGEDVK